MGYKKVLVPLDGSILAQKALVDAEKLVKESGGTIYLLSVHEIPTAQLEGYATYYYDASYQESYKKRIEKIIKEQAKELEQKDVNVVIMIRDGLPYEVIIETCKEEDIDVVVMTTHGHTGITRWIMGSVAERVVRLAPCSVFIIREKQQKEL
jgi:nucleotide-binding universal stress UspA family protein